VLSLPKKSYLINTMSTKHILSTIKPKDKNFSAADAVNAVHEWLVEDFALRRNCRQPSGSNQRYTRCTCMTFLAEEENRRTSLFVAEYLVRYAGMTREVKRDLLYEWAKVASLVQSIDPNNDTPYMLPGIPVADGQFMICRNALLNLLSEGRKSWKTAMKGPTFIHGGVGKTGVESGRGKNNLEVYESLTIFFNELKHEAAPFATRLIRDETGRTTRDDNPDEVVLAPHLSKHQCYAQWCYLRGWKVQKKSSALTTYNSLSDFTPRPYDDDEDIPLWPDGAERMKVISWPTFFRFWKKKYSYIKIRKRGADTCTDCQVLCHEFRTRQARIDRRRQATGRTLRQDDDDGDSSESEDSTLSVSTTELDEEEVEEEVELMADTVRRARKHVSDYQIQRKYARSTIDLGRSDITNLLPSLLRRKVLTIDMGQNLCLPNFEAEQPGDTFYLSPLTVLLFGVVDNAVSAADRKDRMNAYIWREDQGDRGANNIASCLLMDLKRRGWFNSPNFSELTYIADNCGGQNKNKIVVRFLMWLVEIKLFPRIRLLFLVKGHTKNAADRMFNLLKLSYHNKDIFTYEQLYETLNTNQYVDVFKMLPCHFHDHRKWQDTVYKTPAGGEFNTTHVFSISAPNYSIQGSNRQQVTTTTLLKQDNNESIVRYDNLLPTTRSRKAQRMNPEERARKIANMEEELVQLVPTGLKPIKQVELYSKWRPLLPEEFRDTMCPKPSEEVINLIKERNKEKRRTSTKQKKLKTAKEISDKNSEKPSSNDN